MKKGRFKIIIYLISFTVLVTVGIQVYRNVQNYELNKQRLLNEVRQSLDNAIEAYYAKIAKDNLLTLVYSDDTVQKLTYTGEIELRRDPSELQEAIAQFRDRRSDDTIFFQPNPYRMQQSWSIDTGDLTFFSPEQIQKIDVVRGDAVDSLSDSRPKHLMNLANRVFVSLSSNQLNFERLKPFLDDELKSKSIDIGYAFVHTNHGHVVDSYNDPDASEFVMHAVSNSTYLSGFEKLEMRFTNASLIILKRGMTDLIISLLISITVIGSLLYLYRIINQQKQVAEIKNDLISNITHEFKTPIATVSTALEGISNFNSQNDPEKTKKYLDISNSQLNKLNVMVEKLLETATLDTDALELSKTPVNLSQMLQTMLDKYRMVATDKTIRFADDVEDAIIEADAFHLENALSNLIDNAVKYGGELIEISIARKQHTFQVVVQDNGGFIEKSQKERVFEKFYRIPKGNKHDVKGFGIGLYYTKKIIEKHGGTIDLVLAPNLTSFQVAI